MGNSLTYFSLLGITEDASQEEIEARYNELAAYLTSAAVPAALQDWARQQAALLDEAYAILTDPDLKAAAREPVPAPTAPTPVAAPAPTPKPAAAAQAPAAAPKPARPGRPAGPAAPPEKPVSAARALLMGIPWQILGGGVVVGLVLLVGIVAGGELFGGGGSSNNSAASAGVPTAPPLDTAKVAQLMTQIQQDPNNIQASFDLGETFFEAEQWQNAITWLSKVLTLDPSNANPNNVPARTDIGTANFNLGNYATAKQTWLAALQLKQDDPQLHYNLGFFYANIDPVDMVAARKEWETVIKLAPGSNLASTVQIHLDSLPTPGPSPSAAATTPAATAAAQP